MGSTQSILTSFGLMLAGSLVSFLGALYWHKRNQAAIIAERVRVAREEALRDTEARIRELETKLALVNQAVVPISTAFQALLIKELTHFHTPVMDALMAKVGPPSTLTEDEEKELAAALEQRMHDMNGQISDAERDAAKMLPLVMKRAKLEALVMPETKVTVVAVPITEDEKAQEKLLAETEPEVKKENGE